VLIDQATAQILVIEHNVWVRLEVVTQLVGDGYQVQGASNGFSGLRLAHQAVPDVIVLGAELPDLTADELREELRCDPRTRSIPVVPLRAEGGNVRRSVPAGIHKAVASRVVS
jgi:two-component system cell cycle response regulator